MIWLLGALLLAIVVIGAVVWWNGLPVMDDDQDLSTSDDEPRAPKADSYTTLGGAHLDGPPHRPGKVP